MALTIKRGIGKRILFSLSLVDEAGTLELKTSAAVKKLRPQDAARLADILDDWVEWGYLPEGEEVWE